MGKLTYTNSRGQSVELNSSGPFYLSDFDTGTPKTTMLTSKAPGQDGVTREDTIFDERSPVANGAVIGISFEDTLIKRKWLCSVLNPKLMGVLIYENDTETYKINCTVQEIPTFKNGDSIAQEFQIQFYCPDPYWKAIDEIKEEMADWVGDFEFTFEIPNDTGIEMGHRMSTLIANCFNNGDIECGIKVEFTALASVVNPSILNVYTQEFIKVKRTLAAGDKIVINTEFGNKKVEMIHDGISTNVFNYIDLQTTFLQLEPGDNLLRYDAESGIDNLEVAIYFTPKYVGV
jgi:hypothetical protein